MLMTFLFRKESEALGNISMKFEDFPDFVYFLKS